MSITKKLTPRAQAVAILLIAASGLSGCFDNHEEVDIPVSEVPANIITIVQNTLPGISLTEAEKKLKGKSVTYELEGKLINGKEYEIEISADGTIIKVELED